MAGSAKTVAVLVFAGEAVFASAAAAQQIPPQGCNACVTAAHPPASSGLLIRVLRGPGGPGAIVPYVHLSLPPPPDRSDTGAVEASARIVLGRNRKLRENLAVAEAASHPVKPIVTPREGEGEVVIRIASIHPTPPMRDVRRDIPRDAFEAIPLRRVPYPQWSPQPR